MNRQNKYLVHISAIEIKVYELEQQTIQLHSVSVIRFEREFVLEEWLEETCKSLIDLLKSSEDIQGSDIKLYVTGLFSNMDILDRLHLVNHIYVSTGLYCNFVKPELEKFYMSHSKTNNIIEGILFQEFREVVICGSFQQHLNELGQLKNKLEKKGTVVLSPWTTEVVPESLGTDFIRLVGQRELINSRDTWTHKFEHMEKFIKADAIIICNPGGIVGQGTMFEFGFMVAYSKRIIFTEKPKKLSIYFPYEIGLNL